MAYGASVPRPTPDAAASADGDVVEVRRSARRRRTVTAYREMGRTVVLIPAAFSPAEERRWVAQMVAKLQTREERRRRSLGGDTELMTRARALSAAHLDGLAEPASVRWVDNQHRRWGSCTPADRSIRLSSRLRSMPDYVVDYVLVHELVHLLEPGHDDRFWTLVGLELRPRRLRDAATVWGAMGQRYGSAERDRLWSHPDLLPTSDDLDEPLDFVARQDMDDELAGLTASDAEPAEDDGTPEKPADEQDER